MRKELTGVRDLTFSGWHRSLPNDWLDYIDIDYCGYCHVCRQPLVLIEVTEDRGQTKATTVTRRMAEAANVPAYLVMYRKADSGGIESCRMREITPNPTKLWSFTADQLWSFLEGIHADHYKADHPSIVWPPKRRQVAS